MVNFHPMSVLPGDRVPESPRYGPGIGNGRALVAGTLKERAGVSFVESNFRRYVPAAKDLVIGTIGQRGGEHYRVSLQSFSKPVRLNQMSFENATKKNKPNLIPGDVVYARVMNLHRDLDAEIECCDAKTGKSTGLGQLKGGTVINIGLGFARHLLFDGHPMLEELGKKYAYELAIGVNGKVWVKGPDAPTTLAICNKILEAEQN